MTSHCEFPHPHPNHPCGRQVIDGATTCPHCAHVDGSPDCHCWTPATEAHLDALICEGMEGRLQMSDTEDGDS